MLNYLRSCSIVMFVVLISIAVSAKDRGITNTSSSPYVKLRSVDIDDVKWTKGFWAEKFDLCHKVMIPNMWRLLKDPNISHAYTNFLVAAGLKKGEFKGTWWHDGDFYKWLEATAHVYAVTKDDGLDRLMDKVIEVIGQAQQEDGYISTPIILGYRNVTKRFEKLNYHELYNMGHLMTAGCIHYRATGKPNLLNIAGKTGDYLYRTFKGRDRRLAHFGFNPSNIMGAVELYRTTQDDKYLQLAKVFVDMRGSAPGGTDQNQTRSPLRKETEAVGHAVTANYLYVGAADVYAETGDKTLLSALEKIWQNVALQKMYVTGATGALHHGESSARDSVHEAYGREYQLPNSTAYSETCANIANAMWNWRMLAITGDARFADIMELVLYNSALSGISIDGKNFFYTNVLRRTKDTPLLSWDLPTRQPYLSCFCCPPNIVRTIAKVHGWAYSISNEGVWINLYGSNKLDTELADGTKVKLKQETDYPWDGKIKIAVDVPSKKKFAVILRIPGWAKEVVLKVNGQAVRGDLQPGKYFPLDRIWSAGDVIELNLTMPVQLIEAHPLVEEIRNQVAIKRGPIVYCLESIDLPEGVRISEIVIPRNIKLKPRFDKELLAGVIVLEGKAEVVEEGDWSNHLYRQLSPQRKEKVMIRLIPYYTWSNRGVSEMTVWLSLDR
ncbi:MAG: glycoside hydrolase family 127 protein [Sedimentisphaerales bacterium]